MGQQGEATAEIGLTGLAVMGQNLARNIASRGIPVVAHNRTQATTDAFLGGLEGDDPLTGAASLEEMVGRLTRPRKVILMVKAGAPVDAVLEDLLPLLEPGDIVIDGGNSFFRDTVSRQERAREFGVSLLGVGISGGEEGALHGPSIMPGGDRAAYAQVESILTRIAAQVDGEPCCRYIGPGGAGHYVKMVHNGIEYADIQLIVESYDLMRHLLGRPAPMSWPPSSRAGTTATWSRSSSRSPASCWRSGTRPREGRSLTSSSTRPSRRARGAGRRRMRWSWGFRPRA